MLPKAVLDAEVKIGELIKVTPKAQGKRTDKVNNELRDTAVPKSKQEVVEEIGFSKKQAQRFEQLADNPELVEQAKAEARANDDIVSRVGERQRCGNLHHHSYLGQVEPLQEVSPTQGHE